MASGQLRKTYDVHKLFQENKITIQNRSSVTLKDETAGLS